MALESTVSVVGTSSQRLFIPEDEAVEALKIDVNILIRILSIVFLGSFPRGLYLEIRENLVFLFPKPMESF